MTTVRAFFAALFTFICVAPASAKPALDLLDLTKNFFPDYTYGEKLHSKQGFCTLVIELENDIITFKFNEGHRNERKFSSSVTYEKQHILIEQDGRSADQGYYSYTNFYVGKQNATLIKGTYYYEPSYDPADSSQVTVLEQKIFFEHKGSGINVNYIEQGGERPPVINCRF